MAQIEQTIWPLGRTAHESIHGWLEQQSRKTGSDTKKQKIVLQQFHENDKKYK